MSLVAILAFDALVVAGFCAVAWALLRRRAPARDALEASFEHQLLHDDLTKLPNRTLFRDRLERALARSVRRRQSCAVLALDLDHFERVNESLGPAVGDRLLREVSTRLDSALRPEDTVARSGGDEFMVLLESVRTPADAIAVADRITEALAPPFTLDGRELHVSASIGIALGRGGRDRPEDILQNAEVAVHRAKDGGRARTEVFRQEMNPHPLQRLGLEADLRRAAGTMDFALAYQPIVDLGSGRVTAVEALLRWRHPERGVVDPLEFLPVAEETGLILPIGRWVLRTACAEAAGWTRRHGLRLCVNLSPRQVQQPRLRLADEVAGALKRGGLATGSLCVELTESAVMADPDAAVEAIAALKGVGVELALDDFGTGYSSLSRLRRFPVDVIKIDRSFVAEVDVNAEGEAIVRALVEVCHALHAQVLAEGVETAAQARLLADLGCDAAQGSCFSKPLPAARIEQLLERSLLPA